MPAGEPVRRACEAALAVGASRFIYLSSTAIYGPTAEGEVVDEDSSLALYDADAAPRVSDESAVEGGRLSGLSTVILRLAAVYGPGRGVRERLKAGNYKLIDEGEHMFSRVHVDDVVGVILAAADRAPNPAIYCVADDRPTTQKEYADWLVARMGAAPPPSVASLAPGRPRRPVRNRAVSNARLKRELGYVFRYPTYLEGELAVEVEQGPSPTTPPSPPSEPAPTAPAPISAPPAATSAAAPSTAHDEAKAILKKAQELTQLLQRLLADLELTMERWKQR
jgi:nucleoside-diphosphate-sugar epimerase